jgi:adenine phosphoribosyltransferase
MFRDITPLLAHPQGLTAVIQGFKTKIAELNIGEIDCSIGIESRGFILGASLAMALGCSFVPVRKPKKLPSAVFRVEYALEYGTDILEVKENERAFEDIIIVDDVLATGGTLTATEHLLNAAGYNVVGAIVLIDLTFLHSDIKIGGKDVVSLIQY